MWETVKEAINGENGIGLILLAMLIILLALYLVKGKYLRINTGAVKIGDSDTERMILRQQTEWAYQYIQSLHGVLMQRYPELDSTMTKLILEYVYDEVVTWIMFNHISKSEIYISVKSDKVKGIVFSIGTNPVIKDEKFVIMMSQWVKEIICRLVEIREYYSKQ